MASRVQNQQTIGGITISSKRGLSAKGREKLLTQTRDSQQPPPQDANEGTLGQTNPNASMTQTKNLLTKRNKKPAYMQSLNEAEKAENFKIIDSMNKKISFLKNPRFKVNKVPILMTQAGTGSIVDKENPFRVEPQIVQFVDYQVNGLYEIPLKITNSSGISRRLKFIPPATENFTIRSIKYPSKQESGDIAPGLSVLVNISFSAPSFADFDDFLTVVTEENSFKVPLRARRDPPAISLVNPLDCLHSWIGDRVDMAFRCVNTGGDGGFKFFCEKDEDDSKQTDPDTIRIGAFTLTPSEFYLYSGNAIDIYVSFAPDREGQLEENLILACDNQTSEFYKLTGYGAKLDLDVVGVDGRDVDFKANPFSTLFFENTNPTSSVQRTIKIKNQSPILVPFHWSIFKNKNTNKITLQDEHTHYRIEPSQGKIQGGQTMEFNVFFTPEHAEPYYEFADLIIEDIPIQAVRNPPEGLKNFVQVNQVKSRIPMPTYVGSNTQFLSIPLIQFNMRGQGNSCQVKIEPPVLFYEGDLFINHSYTQTVKLRKDYDGTIKYKLRMEGKNADDFDVDIRCQGQSLKANQNLINSELKNEKEIDIEVTISSQSIGEKMAYFYIEVEDGAPMTFQCVANFRGPILQVVEPVINYGLVKVNTQQKFRLSIENTSPIESHVLIKNTKNKRLNFGSFSQLEKAAEDQEMSLAVSKTTNGNLIRLDNTSLVIPPLSRGEVMITLDSVKNESVEEYFEIMVKDSDTLYFQILAEVQKPRVTLNRNIINLGKIYAGVTEVIDYDNKQSITLKNFGNIPANFYWEEKIEQDRIIARFEPSRGTIPPKSEIQIYFSTTVFIGGKIDELFICNIDDVEIPLGFELHADAFGLNVSYETTEDTVAPLFNMTQNSFALSGVQLDQTRGSGFDHMSERPMSHASGAASLLSQGANQFNSKQLRMLNFPSCTINKSSSQKFILKNLSGIKTSFKLSSLVFEPLNHQAPQQKSEVQQAQENQQKELNDSLINTSSPDSKIRSPGKGGKQIRFAPSAKSGSTKFGKSMLGQEPVKKWTRPILSDEHEQTQKFSSATGTSFTATKKIEREQAFFLSNNKGIAIVFSPQMGELPPHSEVPITVTIYNNVCGKFDDKIISEVKGLPPVEFPISIGITGSPVVIPPNQVGLNYKTYPPTLPMPTIVTNSQPIQKTFTIKNSGIRAVVIDWKIYDQKDLVEKDTDFFNLSVIKNLSYDRKENPFKFHYEVIEPQESTDSAFDIQPKQTVLGSRETQTFTVTFYSNKGVGEFKSIVIATPQLTPEELQIAEDSEEFAKKGSLGIVSLNLQAMTIQPRLTIDKKSRIDGENHMNFKYWSLLNDPEAPSAIQKIVYTNDSKADMTFNLNISGPFEIVKTKSNTGAKHPLAQSMTSTSKVIKHKAETMFCLQPLKILEVSIKLLAPQPSNNEEWPMTIKNERFGELVAYFQNGEQQKLMLDAFLLRPKLELLTEKPSKNVKALDELDFGTVNVDKFRTIKVFLTNVTEVTAKWKLNYVSFPKKQTIGYSTMTPWEIENMNKNDDPDVFEFSVTDGLLKGRSLPLRKMPEGLSVPPVPKDEEEKKFLPQTILINFRPKLNVLYKSKFRFTVENGISCDIILKGHGSYEENHD